MYIYTDKNSHGYAVKYHLTLHGYSIKNSHLTLHGYSMKFSLFYSSWL
jgi:hypothetical protein